MSSVSFQSARVTGFEGGNSSNPGIFFRNDPNTGFYNYGNNNIYLGIDGASKLQFTATDVRNRAGTYYIGNATYPITAFIASDGSATTPSYTFGADTDTGIYRISSNSLGLAVNGALALGINSSGNTYTSNSILSGDGSAGLPSFTFTNDSNTGMYRVASNRIGWAVGGAAVLNLNSTSLFSMNVSTLGTNTYPWASCIIANDSYYKALNSSGNETNLIGISSGNITYISSNSGSLIGIAPGGTARYFFNTNGEMLFNSSTNVFRANTSDGSDTYVTHFCGGGDSAASRGSFITFTGNEYSGHLYLYGGNAAGADILINAVSTTGEIRFYTASTERWYIDQNGQFSTDGHSIRLLGDNCTVAYPVVDGIAAAGTTQGTAYALNKTHTRISSASAGAADGVLLPDIWGGGHITIYNSTGVTVNVYPHSGGNVNALATNASFSLPGAEMAYFVRLGTRWYGFKIAV